MFGITTKIIRGKRVYVDLPALKKAALDASVDKKRDHQIQALWSNCFRVKGRVLQGCVYSRI